MGSQENWFARRVNLADDVRHVKREVFQRVSGRGRRGGGEAVAEHVGDDDAEAQR